MANSNPSSKLLTGVLIGSAIGLTCSLLDPTTRKSTMNRLNYMKNFSTQFIENYRSNPDQVKKEMKDTLESTSDSMKGMVDDSQELYKHIQSTVVDRSNDIKEMVDDFKQLYYQTKRHYQKITHTFKDTKEQLIHTTDLEEESQLPMTVDNREVMKMQQRTL